MPIYYRNRKTKKIEGKFVGCDTLSPLFRNKELYERFVSSQDFPLDVKAAPSRAVAPTREKVPWWRRILKALKPG